MMCDAMKLFCHQQHGFDLLNAAEFYDPLESCLAWSDKCCYQKGNCYEMLILPSGYRNPKFEVMQP